VIELLSTFFSIIFLFIFFVAFITFLFSESWRSWCCIWLEHNDEGVYNSSGILRESVCKRCGRTLFHYPPYEDFE
jgi:hypothetical protein